VTGFPLAPGLILPLEAVTETFGILGVRGSGKSNAAAVMVEGFAAAKLPFCVIDPVGAWWGLRSSRDGKGPGLQVPIFGGLHGDFPLGAGEELADILAEMRLSCVVDVSELSEGEKKRHLTAFAERLYRQKAKQASPLHLVLEEADDYAPQRPFRDEARLLRAWENIVRRGRMRGLGITMITQRSASLNKNLLTQIGTLIVMRTTSPQDRKAVLAWVDYHGQAHELVNSLPTLKPGEGWLWSPQFLGKMEQAQFPRRATFDSAATPRMTKGLRPAVTLAEVDAPAIRKRLAASIERAKAEDPRELRKEVATLKAKVRELEARKPEAPAPEMRVEKVPVLKAKDREIIKAVCAKLEKAAAHTSEIARLLVSSGEKAVEFKASLEWLHDFDGRLTSKMTPPPPLKPAARPAAPAASIAGMVPYAEGAEGPKLRLGERRLLSVLASRHPVRLTLSQAATLAKLRKTGGTWGAYLGTLRRAGLVSQDGDFLDITESGFAYFGGNPPSAPCGTDQIVKMWKERLRSGERRMLDALLARHPEGVSREELSGLCGNEMSGGTFGAYLGTLRRNGLAEERDGHVYAGEALFA